MATEAEPPTGGFVPTLKRAFAAFRKDDIPTVAAGLTYYAVLSIFPAMIAMVALLGVFGEYPRTSDGVINVIRDLGASPELIKTVQTTIEGVVKNSGGAGALLGVGLAGAIWSASGYVSAFFKAANVIYAVEEGRPAKRLIPLRLGLTVVFLIAAVFAAMAFVGTASIARSIFGVIGLGDTAVDVWKYAKFPTLGLIVVGMIALLYFAAPNVQKPRFRLITVGGATGLVAMIAVSVLFSLYISNFNSYNKTYGTLALMPLALTWVWILNIALLFGAEVDAEIARNQAIADGLRPPDTEPFLPLREEPDPPKDGAELAREQSEEDAPAPPPVDPATGPYAPRT
jgi:membrane protein